MTKEALQRMMGGLIVSCQVAQGHPMHAPQMIATLARCAELGGARALRIDHPSNVRAVRAAVGVPIVGLHKVLQTFGRPLITPSFDLAAGLALAGADIIALEATHSAEVSTPILAECIRRVHDELRLQVMADVSTVGEGVRAPVPRARTW